MTFKCERKQLKNYPTKSFVFVVELVEELMTLRSWHTFFITS
jgi:hypothetical protein